jgi:hypothetical protein
MPCLLTEIPLERRACGLEIECGGKRLDALADRAHQGADLLPDARGKTRVEQTIRRSETAVAAFTYAPSVGRSTSKPVFRVEAAVSNAFSGHSKAKSSDAAEVSPAPVRRSEIARAWARDADRPLRRVRRASAPSFPLSSACA